MVEEASAERRNFDRHFGGPTFGVAMRIAEKAGRGEVILCPTAFFSAEGAAQTFARVVLRGPANPPEDSRRGSRSPCISPDLPPIRPGKAPSPPYGMVASK